MATRRKAAPKKRPVDPDSPVHAVVGTDEAEVKRVAAELASNLTAPEAGEFGADVIDGAVDLADAAVTSIQSTIDALMTLPFFGGAKLVWLKNVSFLADNQTGRAGSVIDALERLAQVLTDPLPEGVTFLLSAIGVDKRRSFYKKLAATANLQLFDQPDMSKGEWEEVAAEQVVRQAAEVQLNLAQEEAMLLAQLTGGDGLRIRSELEKLSVYIEDDRPVEEEDILRLVSDSYAGTIWEIGNAIRERSASRAIRALDRSLNRGENPIGLLAAAIIPTVRNLLLVKDLMEKHNVRAPSRPWFFANELNAVPDHAMRHLPRKKDGTVNAFGLGNAAIYAGKHDLCDLVRGLEDCLAAYLRLVSTPLDPRVVLTELLTRLTA